MTGLRELQGALRQVDADLPKAVRLSLNAAMGLVVDAARPKIPRRSGAAVSSLRPQSTPTKARIAVGGRKAAYYPFLDFGGRVGRGGSVHRDYRPAGRYLYPALAANAIRITEAMSTQLDAIVTGAGLDVT